MAHWRSSWRHLARLPEVWRCLRTFSAPLQLIREYLRLSAAAMPRELVLRDGKRLSLDSYEDLVTAWVIFCRREYRVPEGTRTVLDLGANVGMFTLHAAVKSATARIVAAEPFPPTFARLVETIARNNLQDRVSLLPIGVAAAAGKRLIPDAPHAPRQSLGMSPLDAGGQGTQIAVVSLGDLIESALELLETRHIDFLKMDVEGAEHEALHAVPPHMMQRVDAMAIEYHPGGDKTALFERIGALGFALVHDRPISAASGVAHWRRAA